ncbi:MAG: hypothetical protein KY475_15185, partial [Planctomycetes bacterium]|nr:hypothetical protein [Planctomycetota bacterium]
MPGINALTLLAASLLAGGCAPDSPGVRTNPSAQQSLLEAADVERRNGAIISLSITAKAVTGEQFAEVARHSALRRLTLQEVKGLDAQSLAPLGKLPQLQVLHCIRVPVDDSALEQLSADQTLSDLLLAHTQATGSGLCHLSEAPLERLALHGASFTAEGLACLPQLACLRELEIACPHLTLAE